MKYNVIGTVANVALCIAAAICATQLAIITGSILILVCALLFITTVFIVVPNGDDESFAGIYVLTTVAGAIFLLILSCVALCGVNQHFTLERLTATGQATILEIVPKVESDKSYLKINIDGAGRYTVPLYNEFPGVVGDIITVNYNPDDIGSKAYGEMYSTNMSLYEALISQPNPEVISEVD